MTGGASDALPPEPLDPLQMADEEIILVWSEISLEELALLEASWTVGQRRRAHTVLMPYSTVVQKAFAREVPLMGDYATLQALLGSLKKGPTTAGLQSSMHRQEELTALLTSLKRQPPVVPYVRNPELKLLERLVASHDQLVQNQIAQVARVEKESVRSARRERATVVTALFAAILAAIALWQNVISGVMTLVLVAAIVIFVGAAVTDWPWLGRQACRVKRTLIEKRRTPSRG